MFQPFQGLSHETRSSLPRKPRAIPLYRTKMLYTIFVRHGWMISFALVRPTYATAHDRIVLFVIVVGSSMLSTHFLATNLVLAFT